MDEDRQTAARGFTFPESREGYQQFQSALQRLAKRHGGDVHFHIRIDAAGQYAVNLEVFLRQLPFPTTISVGEPKRNKDYKNAHFPKRKADPVDSLACARFAIVERPPATQSTPAEFIPLRDLAGALALQATASSSTGSLRGPLAEQLVQHLVDEVRQSRRAEQNLGELLEQALDALPAGGHQQLLTIPGIGRRTAASSPGPRADRTGSKRGCRGPQGAGLRSDSGHRGQHSLWNP